MISIIYSVISHAHTSEALKEDNEKDVKGIGFQLERHGFIAAAGYFAAGTSAI